jgi:hypothetical protein
LLNSKQGNAQGLTSWQIDVVLAKALQWDAAQKKAPPAKPADMNGDALWLIWSMFGGWMVQEWAADKVDTNPYSIGKSGPIEEWVPIWGSGRDAINDLQNGRYGSAFVNSVFTLADLFGGAGKVAKGVLKGAVKVGVKAVARTAAKQGAQAVLRNGVLHVVRQGTLNGLRKLGQVEARKVVGATVRKALQGAGKLAGAARKGGRTAARRAASLFFEQMCFTPDTLVATAQGPKPIGKVQPGEMVRAYDFASGRWVQAEVQQRHDNVYSGRLVKIGLGGACIDVTANHPFWVVEGERLPERPQPGHLAAGEDEGGALAGRWVNSHDVEVGDRLYGGDGRCYAVEDVEQREGSQVAVCNLTVRGQHTFGVGALGVLVHNDSWCDILAKYITKPPNLVKMAKQLSKVLKNAKGKPLKVVVHAHHIVMKGIPSYFTRAEGAFVTKARAILKDAKIPIFYTMKELRASGGKNLHNLTWALNNHGTYGIHSPAYAKAVLDRLEKAVASAAKEAAKKNMSKAEAFALKQAKVKKALKDMAKILMDGDKFW